MTALPAPGLAAASASGYMSANHGNLGMLAVFVVLHLAISLYWWILVASAVFSWLYAFNVVNPRNQVVAMIGNALFQLTEPVLRPVRKRMPDLGGIDISPIIVLLALTFIEIFMHNSIEPLFGVVHR